MTRATTAPESPASGRTFSSRRPVTLGLTALAVLLGGSLGWGIFASISGAVIAPGRVEVESRVQAVEHVDGGTVAAVLVRNGDRVEAGTTLLRFADGELRTEEAILGAEHAELVARRNRLEAEYRDADVIRWDAVLAERAEADARIHTILEGQRRLFEARRTSQAGQAAQLRERIAQTRRQVASLEAQLEAVHRQGRFLARELEPFRKLFEEGRIELQQLMDRERAAARLDGEAGDIGARIAAAHNRIAELELQILQIRANRAEEAEGEARETQAREAQVHERLTSVRARLARMEVRAPVPGEVFEMKVFAPAEVVHPGESILKILPADAALVVRAQLEPIHIDQAWPGQEAWLLFPGLPARTTPAFDGSVLRVAADASVDPRSGLAWYEVELAIGEAVGPEAKREIETWAPYRLQEGMFPGSADPERRKVSAAPVSGASAELLALTPGMPVEVYLRTGERSPLSYLVKPLSDYFSRSLREE